MVTTEVGLLAFCFLAAPYVPGYGRAQQVTDPTIGRLLGVLVDRVASTRR